MSIHLQILVGNVLPQQNTQPEAEEVTETPVEQPATSGEPNAIKTIKDASPETPAVQPDARQEEPQSVPLPIFMELKHDIRDVKSENALLRQQLAEMQFKPQAQATQEIERDPLDIYVEEHAPEYDDDPDQVPLTPKVIKEHEAYLARQAQVQSQSTANKERAEAIEMAKLTWTDQKCGGPGLGYNSILSAAEHLLTDGDIYDAQLAGKDAPTVLYRQAVQRLAQAGTPEATAIVQRISAVLNPTKTTPEPAAIAPTVPGTGNQTPAPGTEQVKPPTREEILGRHPTLANLGLLGDPDDEAA